MENLILSINCVVPIFLTICVGMVVRRSGLVSRDTFQSLTRLCFHALLPAMMFNNVYSSGLDETGSPGWMVFLVAGLLVWFALSWTVCTRVVEDRRRRGAYIQNMYRSNIAVIGVSLAQSMLDAAGVAMMTMAVAVLVPIYNVLAVIALESCRGEKIRGRELVKDILKNPLILATLLGLCFLTLEVPLPACVRETVGNLGKAGSVLTLVALGGSFRFDGVRENCRRIGECAFLRLVFTPAVALSAALALGFRHNALGVVLICTATPMAATSYPMAVACDSDHQLTGQIVVTSSLLCCLTVFLWIFFLKQAGVL